MVFQGKVSVWGAFGVAAGLFGGVPLGRPRKGHRTIGIGAGMAVRDVAPMKRLVGEVERNGCGDRAISRLSGFPSLARLTGSAPVPWPRFSVRQSPRDSSPNAVSGLEVIQPRAKARLRERLGVGIARKNCRNQWNCASGRPMRESSFRWPEAARACSGKRQVQLVFSRGRGIFPAER